MSVTGRHSFFKLSLIWNKTSEYEALSVAQTKNKQTAIMVS